MVKCCFKNQSGQALLIVVLVMVIALTIGLAVASKSIVSMRTSTEQSESQRALSAAEAGIEQILKASLADNPQINKVESANSPGYTAKATLVNGQSFSLNGGNIIAKNEGFDLWLSDYSTDPNLIYKNPWGGAAGSQITIGWGDSADSVLDCSNAALEIVVLSIPPPSVSIPAPTKDDAILTRYAVDPCTERRNFNHFMLITRIASPGLEIAEKNYFYATSIVVKNGLLVRIIPLYYSTSIGIDGGVNSLPSQGSIIESTGEANQTTRKVTVFRGYPRIPAELFPYSLFTP
jgi:hypothetical protein